MIGYPSDSLASCFTLNFDDSVYVTLLLWLFISVSDKCSSGLFVDVLMYALM